MMYTKEFIHDYVKTGIHAQCRTGLWQMLNLFNSLNPTSYMEIGCGNLLTLKLFHDLIRPDGMVIGIDVVTDHRDKEAAWAEYDKTPTTHLFIEGSQDPTTVSTIQELCKEHPLDFLFIDGDHEPDIVRDEWNFYSPCVRKGGIIAFHDYNIEAVRQGITVGEGAGVVCKELRQQGYDIRLLPETSIATAYIVKP